jgi:hypothetical protein
MNTLIYVELRLSLNIKNKLVNKNTKKIQKNKIKQIILQTSKSLYDTSYVSNHFNLGGQCHIMAIKMITIHNNRGSYFSLLL